MRVVICAYDYREARDVQTRLGLPNHEAVIATRAESLRGLREPELGIHTTWRFWQRPDALEIQHELELATLPPTILHKIALPAETPTHQAKERRP